MEDGGDWRTHVQPDSRQTIVDIIMETLKRHLPFSGQEGLQALNNMAVRFEEEIFSAAISQSDYLGKIPLKILTIETTLQNSMANSLPSNAAANSKNPQDPASQSMTSQIQNQVQPLPMSMVANQSQFGKEMFGQNIPNNMASTEVRNSAGLTSALPPGGMAQGTMPNIAGLNPTMQNIQNMSNVAPNSVGNFVGQGMPAHMQQNQLIRQQNSILDGQKQQMMMAQQNNVSSLQQQQTINQHGSLPNMHKKQSTFQRSNLPNVHQQQLGPQSSLSGFQQQPMVGVQHSHSATQTNQQPMRRLQQSKVAAQLQLQQKISDLMLNQAQQCQTQSQPQQAMLMSQIQSQPGQLQQPANQFQQRIQPSGFMLKQLPTIDHQKQLMQPQRIIPEVPLTSVDSGSAGTGDWQEEVYQKIKTMHEMYFPELNEMYLRMAAKLQQLDSLPQQPNNEQHQKLRFYKVMLERLIIFLRTNKNEIQPSHNEKIVGVEKQIVSFLNSNRPRKQPLNSNRPSPQVLQAASPQLGHHPSPQLDQQNMLSHPKAGTPLQSTISPFIVLSPSTSVAPSPILGDSQKINTVVSSLSHAGNIAHHPTTGASTQAQSVAIGSPGISASALRAEFTSPDRIHGVASTIVSGGSNVVEQPLERLMKAVKSMSSKALRASVSDISSVVSMVDRIAGSAPGNSSRAAVGEDLVVMTKCRLQARNYFMQDGPGGTKRMRRYTSAMSSNVCESDSESNGESTSKRPKTEADHVLEEELREINRRLIDTVVYISEDDVDPTAVAAAAEGSDGTIVKRSYSAVALSSNLKSQYASAQISPNQPLRLLVPSNYPKCSPILLDKFPVEVSKEYEDLSIKAKSRFSISLRALAQPTSLVDIAKIWDACAHGVISEHAQQRGGGTFSSKYGTWENCLSAA